MSESIIDNIEEINQENITKWLISRMGNLLQIEKDLMMDTTYKHSIIKFDVIRPRISWVLRMIENCLNYYDKVVLPKK